VAALTPSSARDSYNFAHSWVDRYTINPVKDVNGCVA
jgi:hypothetical protein